MTPLCRSLAALMPGVVSCLTAQAAGNVDTGIGSKQCIEAGASRLVACNATSLSGQDGQLGRDAHAATNGDADGRLGASYERICNSGERAGKGSCPANPVLGPGSDDWGCTRDRLSTLVWEVKTASGPRAASNVYTNYSRDYDPLGLYRSPTDAQGYVDAVNRQGLCGSKEWGLGHSTKLQTVIDFGVDGSQGRLDPAFFPNSVTGPHWNASYNPSRADTAWALDYGTGTLDNFGDRGLARPVMLVLGKKASGTQSTFTLSADGTEATDLSPGATITWRRCAEGLAWDGAHCVGTPLTFTLEDALLHAEAEGRRTGVGWRVPNVKELGWTVRHEYTAPSVNPDEFPDMPVGVYCTSTPDVVRPARAWVIDFEVGLIDLSPRSTPCLLRLARAA